jgi:hypothetical protein
MVVTASIEVHKIVIVIVVVSSVVLFVVKEFNIF